MTENAAQKLDRLKTEALAELSSARKEEEVEQWRIRYLGRKGALNVLFARIEDFSGDERTSFGKAANELKKELAENLRSVMNKMRAQGKETEDFDETVPGIPVSYGSIHPLTQFIDRICAVFSSMGFEVIEDREVETAEYNFDKLNIPEDHPARDMWDTFYIKSQIPTPKAFGAKSQNLVLRTHTSPVQLRAMETRNAPVRLVVPGRCYRHEATDASHETNFYQLEGLVIDEGISVANMIHTVNVVLKGIFGENVRTRIRPSFFPFVEPGHEVDMSCIICEQKGCSVCGKRGWLEMMGAGMVHPYVLNEMGVDQSKYTGFAFGMGIDRMMMLYYGVDDIRLSYSGDLRFLKQF
ncbi:MAG: phenylalanine--tRNA ligase subunit alpha [Candidatus Jacksonbacteria bacterium]|nr:phenylalanine--tRNA ligase subunit alpha [Candidatus Jacksonbacteria bacterium]